MGLVGTGISPTIPLQFKEPIAKPGAHNLRLRGQPGRIGLNFENKKMCGGPLGQNGKKLAGTCFGEVLHSGYCADCCPSVPRLDLTVGAPGAASAANVSPNHAHASAPLTMRSATTKHNYLFSLSFPSFISGETPLQVYIDSALNLPFLLSL